MLIESTFDDSSGSFRFSWELQGSEMYSIEAYGRLDIGWHCECSCPDGEKRAYSAPQRVLAVCKHAAAALNSVCDPMARAVSMVKRDHQDAVREQQNRLAPGERDRIDAILERLDSESILGHVKSSVSTLEGLQALAIIFPAREFPFTETRYCNRCLNDVDPFLQPICQIEHADFKTHWYNSKDGHLECLECGGTFGSFGRANFEDDDPICFRGEHDFDDDDEEEEEEDDDDDDDVNEDDYDRYR